MTIMPRKPLYLYMFRRKQNITLVRYDETRLAQARYTRKNNSDMHMGDGQWYIYKGLGSSYVSVCVDICQRGSNVGVQGALHPAYSSTFPCPVTASIITGPVIHKTSMNQGRAMLLYTT